MKTPPRLRNIERLLELRKRQLEALAADMASRRALQARFRGNIERLEALCRTSGPSGGGYPTEAALSTPLSLNCAGYKQSVMKMVDAHRIDLELHEADTAVAHRELASAKRREEALSQLIEKARSRAQRVQAGRQRKVQDEVSIQMWDRLRKRRPPGA
jgi:flagellar export protein FliJ